MKRACVINTRAGRAALNTTASVKASVLTSTSTVTNLISNSLDALDKDEKFIHIKGVVEGNQIAISIKDNGKGIRAEILSRVFDPFFTTKDVGKGTGLGLHIVSKEIERHGGQIKVFSELNVGTEFLITLPALADFNKVREAA